MKRPLIALLVAGLLLLVGCSTSGQGSAAGPVSPASSASSTPSTDAPTTEETTDAPSSTPPAPPTPTVGVLYTVNADGAAYTVLIAKPYQPISYPDVDGSARYEVGLQIAITPVEGTPSLRPADLTLGATGDVSVDTQYVEGKDTAIVHAACHGQSLFIDNPSISTGLVDVSWDLTMTLTGCITFEYVDPPTSLSIATNNGAVTWPIALAKPLPPLKPRTLASYSGSGSRLIPVPAAAQNGHICWYMPGDGNHIIWAQDNTSGANEDLLTNALGSTDQDCDELGGHSYLQVISEGSWQITITDF